MHKSKLFYMRMQEWITATYLMARPRISCPEQDFSAVELDHRLLMVQKVIPHFLMVQKVVLSSAIPFGWSEVDRPCLFAPTPELSCIGSFELLASDCGFWWLCIIVTPLAS